MIFQHVEGYDGLPDLAAVRDFVLGAEVSAAAYARNYGGTVKEIRKAPRVNHAFQQTLDHPQAAEALQHPALKPLLEEAAGLARRTGRRAVRSSRGVRMSDHISGPRALADPIADITDVYAFPSPQHTGHLVLVMNTLPFAPPSAAFSDGLVYRFRLRPVTAGPLGSSAPFAAGQDELVFDCVFSAPSGPEDGLQEGVCTTPTGDTVTFRVNDTDGGIGHGIRAFAGVRWDPFIMDAPAALKTIATGQLSFTDPGSIYLDGKNVLGLVLEIDLAHLPQAELVGVVAETLTRGRFNVRIERVGRPEVKNMMLTPKQFDLVNRDLEIRDLYNMEDAFHLAAAYLGAYRARLDANLRFWDGLDGTIDWPTNGDGGRHPLTELVLADFLVVDVTKPYHEHGSFLEIEIATRRGEAHRTCGGRSINDDVMDTIFTQLVNGGNGPVIRDGVDHSSRPASVVFPYLSPPNPDPPALPEHH